MQSARLPRLVKLKKGERFHQSVPGSAPCPIAEGFGRAGALHLHDIRAHVEQQGGGRGAGGDPAEIAERIATRFGGLVDTIGIPFPADADPGAVRAVVREVQAIPARFQGFRTKRPAAA